MNPVRSHDNKDNPRNRSQNGLKSRTSSGVNIIQKSNRMIRKKSTLIPLEDITKHFTQKLIREMSEALRLSPAGIGLAAIQIGIPKAIFIVSEYVLKPEILSQIEDEEMVETPTPSTRAVGAPTAKRVGEKKEKEKYLVFINPRLIKTSKKKGVMPEGCLSVKGVYGKVKRPTNITVEAYNEEGKKFRRGAGGLFAQVIQHEMDHLGGVLFIDKVERIDKK